MRGESSSLTFPLERRDRPLKGRARGPPLLKKGEKLQRLIKRKTWPPPGRHGTRQRDLSRVPGRDICMPIGEESFDERLLAALLSAINCPSVPLYPNRRKKWTNEFAIIRKQEWSPSSTIILGCDLKHCRIAAKHRMFFRIIRSMRIISYGVYNII